VFLALDTSTLVLSLAIVRRAASGEFEPVAAFDQGPPQKQSEMLPGAIDELLRRAGVALKDLEGIAVGIGPGSFTGLRIGLATAKALAYGASLKLVGVSSLAALALDGPEGKPLYSVAVARQNDLYVGPYRREGNAVVSLGAETAVDPQALAKLLQENPEALALGPALKDYRQRLLELGVASERLLPAPEFPSAVAIARLAKFPEKQELEALFALEPHYIRSSGAERNPQFPPLPGVPAVSRIRQDD
jgi:tRNA threonylcarbamoyladenosine biosynthesis protein TsaB